MTYVVGCMQFSHSKKLRMGSGYPQVKNAKMSQNMSI